MKAYRKSLLDLTHETEKEHQSYIEACDGFDGFRMTRGEAEEAGVPIDLWLSCSAAGSRAAQLRSVLDRYDEQYRGYRRAS